MFVHSVDMGELQLAPPHTQGCYMDLLIQEVGWPLDWVVVLSESYAMGACGLEQDEDVCSRLLNWSFLVWFYFHWTVLAFGAE